MIDLAKLAKKIKINQVLNVDRQKVKNGELPKKVKPLTVKMVRAAAHIDKQTDYIPKEDLDRIIGVARAHALWLHMDVLKHVFKFTGKQLLIYYDKLKDVYAHAIDDNSGGTVEDIIKTTVHGSRKDDSGNMDYPEYEVTPFDPKGVLYEHYVDKYSSMKKSLAEYKQMQRTFIEFDKCEVASMLVLKDYFGFAHVRLCRFIDTLRQSFKNATWKLYEGKIKYFEKLCKMEFCEFATIKGGKGVFWY